MLQYIISKFASQLKCMYNLNVTIMEIVWIVLNFLLMITGLLGCFIHRLPGPIITFAGILLMNFCTDVQAFSTLSLVICALAVVLCKVLDFYVPRITRLISDYGKAGKWGCIIGSLIGVLVIWPMINYTEAISSKVLILVTGLVVLPFLLAYIGESVARRSFRLSFRPSLAAFSTYLIGTLLKLSVCLYCIYTAFESMGASNF